MGFDMLVDVTAVDYLEYPGRGATGSASSIRC